MSDTYTEFQAENRNNIVWNDQQRTVGVVQYGDGRMNVFFYYHPVLNAAKSKEIGRPFNETKVYVKIAEPGQRLTEVVREATQQDKQKYAREWALFQQNKAQVHDGSPIELLFPNDPGISDNLKGWGFHTVEQVAHANAQAIGAIMGMQSWVNRAQSYIEKANKGVGFHQHQKDLEQRDSQIRVLNQQIDILKQEVAAMRLGMGVATQMQNQATQAQFGGRPVYPQQPQYVQPPVMQDQQRYMPNEPYAHGEMPQAAPGTIPTQQQPGIMPQRTVPLAPVFDTQVAQINAVQPTRRGRPPGSKNKAKVVDLSPVPKLEPPSM